MISGDSLKQLKHHGIIEETVPFRMFSCPTFCKIFELLNKYAMDLVNIHRQDMRESIMRLNKLTKDATDIEMMEREPAWTTDHSNWSQ